jgi:hypothetical protein
MGTVAALPAIAMAGPLPPTAVSVSRIPSVVVGGGTLPLNVTVATPSTVAVTVRRGTAQATANSVFATAGTRLIGIPLVDAHGHRLAGGTYTVTVTDTDTAPGSGTAQKTLRVRVGAGVAGTLVAPPGPRLTPAGRLVFLYSQPVAASGGARPSIRPGVAGRWSFPSPYERIFTPSGLGFGPGTKVTFTLHSGLWTTTRTRTATARVRNLSGVRALQLLAQLGYLPLKFAPRTPVARTASAQVNAATSPPAGRFTWRYAHTPSALVHLWTGGGRSVMVRGAIMAFEVDHRLVMDGTLGPAVWRALETSAITGRGNRFGYTYVHVYRGLPQHLVVWHNGRNVYTALVNTGIAGHQTNYGVFPIYLRQTVGSMSGTNPDGSHYNDSGIRWISYFSGGDALHQFGRPGYGYPQSLGCVEMTDTSAHRVFQLTEYGTLVDTRS